MEAADAYYESGDTVEAGIDRPDDPELALLGYFRTLDWTPQTELVPALAQADSGNLHGFAIKMAFVELTSPEKIPLVAGAMAPLVGSEDYGDPIEMMQPAL